VEGRDWDEGAVLMAVGAAIGLSAGLGVVGFYKLIDGAYFVFTKWLGQRLEPLAHVVTLPLITTAGMVAAWAIVRHTRTPEGQNVPDVQRAVAKRGGGIPGRPVVIRTIASALTLGSGGSAGSEGPVAVLGAATGSAIGRLFRLRSRWVKILVGCGAAAGIAGAFNAPFAGAFFALEEVLGSFSVGAFSPVVVASVVGAVTVRSFLGTHPAFAIPTFGETPSFAIVFLFPLLGIACGLVSALHVKTYFGAADLEDIRNALLHRGDLAAVLLAADLATPVDAVTPGDSLRVALSRMNARAVDAIPVVDSEKDRRNLGVLSRADLLAAYECELAHEV
jgi:CIC family chloride channel protein